MKTGGVMPWRDTQSLRLKRLFLEGFSAMDIAEPLVSFDAETRSEYVQDFMAKKDFDLVGVRIDGLVSGYVKKVELGQGCCGDHCRLFTPEDDLVPDTANFTEVVKSLAINQQCFVTILDHVGAIITLSDLEKPPMRMFLFGWITLGEMLMTELIRQRYSCQAWQEYVSPERLQKAKDIQALRAQQGQKVELLDCLQYGDKGWILTYDEEVRRIFGNISRKEMRRTFKELESLRNNLAHTQQIIPTGWRRITIACSQLEANLERIVELNRLKIQ